MPNPVPLSEPQRYANSAWGVQDLIVIHSVPTAGNQSLAKQKLLGKTLAVDGVYYCLIPMSGITTELEVHLKATFASGTVTSAGPDTLYYLGDYNDPSTWTVKSSGTGDGALTTTVQQDTEVTGMVGEQYALITITIAGGASAVFTMAEYNGL